MARKLSRLKRVQRKREAREAATYLTIAVGIIVVIVIWGIPAFAKFAGLFVNTDDLPFVDSDKDYKPAPPILYDIPEATPSARIDIEGVSDPGMEIILYVDNAEKEKVVVEDSGNFTFRNIRLDDGVNLVYVKAVTTTGMESDKSKIYEVVYDALAPAISISEPEDGTTFRGDDERTVTIAGVVDEDAKSVRVGERIAIVAPDGSFTVKYRLEEGDQEIVVRATDLAGNERSVVLKLRWEK